MFFSTLCGTLEDLQIVTAVKANLPFETSLLFSFEPSSLQVSMWVIVLITSVRTNVPEKFPAKAPPAI